MKQIEDIRKYYDKVNKGFDHTLELYRTKRFRKLMKGIAKGKKSALDIGCASGIFTQELIESKVGSIIALDVSAEMLKVTKKKFKKDYPKANIHYVQANAEYLPFADDAFDVVLQLRVLEYLTDPQLAVTELDRVLVKNASFMTTLPGKIGLKIAGGINKFFYFWVKIILPSKKSVRTADNIYRRFFTRKEAKQLFEEFNVSMTGIDYAVLPKLDGFVLRTWYSRMCEALGNLFTPLQDLSTNLVIWRRTKKKLSQSPQAISLLVCPFSKKPLVKKGTKLVTSSGISYAYKSGIAYLLGPECKKCGEQMELKKKVKMKHHFTCSSCTHKTSF